MMSAKARLFIAAVVILGVCCLPGLSVPSGNALMTAAGSFLTQPVNGLRASAGSFDAKAPLTGASSTLTGAPENNWLASFSSMAHAAAVTRGVPFVDLLTKLPGQTQVGTITLAGMKPRAVAVYEAGNAIFVADHATGTLYKYNATTLVQSGSVFVGAGVWLNSLVVDETTGKVFAASHNRQKVAVVNGADCSLILDLPGTYTNFPRLAIDSGLGKVWALSLEGLRQIDIASLTETTVAGFGGGGGEELAVNTATHKAFVTRVIPNTMVIVDGGTLGTTTVTGMGGSGIEVNTVENKVVVATGSGGAGVAYKIYDVDTTVQTDLSGVNDALNMVFNPTTNRMHTTSEVNRYSTILNGATDAFVNIPLLGGSNGVGVRNATGHAFHAFKQFIAVVDEATETVELIPVTNPTPSSSNLYQDVAINQTTGRVFVIPDGDALNSVIVLDDATMLLRPPVYLASVGSSRIHVYDPMSDTVVNTVTPPPGTLGDLIAVRPGGGRYYAGRINFFDPELSVYAGAGSSALLTFVDTGGNDTHAPRVPAARPSDGRIYATRGPIDDVVVIDPVSNSVVTSVAVGDNPKGLAFTPDGAKLYVANQSSNNVSVISTATNTVSTTIAVGTAPYGVVLLPNGRKAYVANSTAGTVSVINTGTDTVNTTVTVGTTPHWLAVSPDGKRVYVGNRGSGSVSVIDTSNDSVTTPVTGLLNPEGIGVLPDNSKVYVVNSNTSVASSLTVINPGDYSNTSIPLPSASVTTIGVTVADPTSRFAGRVTNSGGGAAISGALVRALQSSVEKGTATTNAAGDYSIFNLVQGTYDLEVTVAGFTTQNLNAQAVGAGRTEVRDFALNPIVLPDTTTSVTADDTSVTAGDLVTYTATVSSGSPGTITGTVQFKEDGNNLGAAVTISGGQAQLMTRCVTIGSHTITAVYSGDSNFNGSTGTMLGNQSVVKPPSVQVDDSFAGSADCQDLGGGNVFNRNAFATITAAQAGVTPGGTVNIAEGIYAESVTVTNESLTLSGNVQISGSLTLAGGTFNSTSGTLSITGNFTHNGGAFNHNLGTVSLTGGALQTLDGTVQTAFRDLTIGSPAGVSLGVSKSVGGVLALGGNILSTGANTLTVGGSVTRTNGYIIGNERRSLMSAGAHFFTFDVGTANGYSPVDATVSISTPGSNSLTVKAVQGQHPNISGANVLQRYWTLAGSFVSTASADLTFHYLAADVIGTETNYKLFKYDGAFTQFNPDVLNTTSHFATKNGVSSFSDWMLAEASSVLPDLVLTKTDLQDPVTEGNSLTYSITVTNNSDIDASNVTVSDTLPANVTFVSTSSGCSESSGTVTCNIGSLAAHASVVKTITVTPTHAAAVAGSMSNTATVTASEGDANPTDNSDTELTQVIAAICTSAPSNILSWYAAENNASDRQGANNGTIQGATFTMGKNGQGFSFDGVDDFVNVPASPSLNPPTQQTLDAWIRPTDLSGGNNQGIIAKQDPGFFAIHKFLLQLNPDGHVYYSVMQNLSNVASVTSTSVVPLNTWTFVAATFDGATLRLYINGQEEGSAPFSSNPNENSYPVTIGSDNRGGYFKGDIDEAEIFTRALSGTEILGLFNAGSAGKCVCVFPPLNIVSWWRAENNALDERGTNNGTLNGDTTFAAGKVGQAFSMDASGDYVEVSDHPSLDFINGFTVDAWVYPSASGGIVTKADNGIPAASWYIEYDVTNQRVNFALSTTSSTTTIVSSNGSVPPNTWSHVAGTSDGTTMKLYVNGVEAGSTASPAVPANNFTLLIGAFQTLGVKEQFYGGRLDEVEVFNRALAETEVAAIYNAGEAGKCLNVNDAPVNTVPASQTINEDTDLFFSTGGGNPISTSDIDAGTNQVQMTLSTTNGRVTLSTIAGLDFSFPGTLGDGTLDTLIITRGTIAAINNALNGLMFRPNADFSGAAGIQLTINDLGNTGTDPGYTGDAGSEEDGDSVNITVNPVNDPDVTIAVSPAAVGEDGAINLDYTFTRSDSAGSLIVSFSISGTATRNVDYTPTGATSFGTISGTVTFGSGSSTATVIVDTTVDATYEANETLILTITDNTAYNVGNPNVATGVITNDDAPPATLVVNTTNDLDDGLCDATHCSLREAINAANFSSDASTIDFNIPNTDPGYAGGVFTIQPTPVELPTISQRVNLDGASQTAFTGDTNVDGPEIVINGGLLPATNNGLLTSSGASNSVIANLVINGFPGTGIAVWSSNTQVLNNYVGTNAAGTAAVPNTGAGLGVGASAGVSSGYLISGNLISGNGNVGLASCDVTGSTFSNNKIGTDRTGVNNIGNGDRGIATFCSVWGSNTITGNTIAFNNGDGWRDDPDYRFGLSIHLGNRVSQNSIHSNAGLAINLSPPPFGTVDGVTPNDPQDTDEGGNHLQNFPVLTSAGSSSGTTTITGSLNSTANTTFTLEFYASTACDSSGNGEGETYIGSMNVTTDGLGDTSFVVSFPASIPAGQVITATATDPAGNTSEFSACSLVSAGLSIPAGSYSTVTIANGTTVTLTGDVTITGQLTLNGDLDTGAFTLTMPAGAITTGTGDVIGNVRRTGFVIGTALSFGNPFNTIRFDSGTPPTEVTMNLVKSAPVSFPNAVERTYPITPVGGSGYSATLQLHYVDTELNGNSEATLEFWRHNGTIWAGQGVATRDATDNWVNLTGVTEFSPWVIAGPGGPTAIELASFTATGYDNGVFIEWKTGLEADNLGFNIYREVGGKRALVNSQLIAGSALKDGASLRAGESYAWWEGGNADCGSPGADCSSAHYWLEDIDLKGASTWHGPFGAKRVAGTPPPRSNAALLSKLGSNQSHADSTRTVESTAPLPPSAPTRQGVQFDLASQPAVKISVRREGWYRVTQPELASAGWNPKIDPRFLQLFVDGAEVPIYVSTGKDGAFDESSTIEFYGQGLDTPSTDARIYWLIVSAQDGKRIGRFKSTGEASSARSFTQTVERKDRTIYFSALRNGDKENFFGAVVAGAGVDQTVGLTHLAQVDTSNFETTLEVALQGVTLTSHRVLVQLNGVGVREITFNGQDQGVARFNIDHSLLREGENTVRLVPQNGASDISLVDHIRVSYQHSFTADNDALKFTATGGQQIAIDGFSSGAIRVFDVTDAASVQELIGEVHQSKTGFTLAVAPRELGLRTLIALTDERATGAASVEGNKPSAWRSPANSADLVIFTAGDLFPAIEPLKAARQAEGYKVALIDVADIYDEFNFGHKSPQAIRDFLSYANANWKLAPRFVLFAGDASFDGRNYLGLGDNDLVPTKLIDTTFMETATDDWFADFNGDGVSDLAVGRLPVRSLEEAATVVSKLLRYSQSKPGESIALVSDANDGFNFEQASTQLRALLPSILKVDEIKRGELDPATAKVRLVEAINRGQKLVNYTGHGSANQWRGDLLTSADARALTNQDRLPVFVMMTCLNGFFHDAALDSLAESLIKAEHGGAVAVWASSGMTFPDQQALINQQLYRQLFGGSLSGKGATAPTLGEATMRAKSAVADPDIRRTWVLFGDPTMRLR